METGRSSISGKEYPLAELVNARAIRPALLAEIRKDHPEFTEDSVLAFSELNTYRHNYVENTLREEYGTLTELEHEVMESIRKGELITENVDTAFERNLTFGQRLADRIAEFGGSWTFIIIFLSFIAVWVALNVLVLVKQAFDPYPFILLNLVLSCVAAIQAPVIMMSQNRLEARDRERAEHDYKVNLKAELEIRMLNEKVDHLMLGQQQKLLEIQQIQTEMLEEIMSQVVPSGSTGAGGGKCAEEEEKHGS